MAKKGVSVVKPLARGINNLSHAQVVRKTARYKWFGKGGVKKVKALGEGGKAPRYYPADDVPVPRKSCRGKHKPTKLRSSIKPGSVLILLAGRFRGKRVVFLKQLPSGTLLVTGPYEVNGVPLRRVNQAYVIATSVVVDISGVKVPDHINDAYFSRPRAEADKKDEDAFLATEKKATSVSGERQADQKAVDGALLSAVKKVDQLEGYLRTKFSLKKGDRPHELKF